MESDEQNQRSVE